MPILRTLVRAASGLIVGLVVLCAVAIGSGARSEGGTLALALYKNRIGSVGSFNTSTHVLNIHPVNTGVDFGIWSPNGRYVIVATYQGVWSVIDTQTGSLAHIENGNQCVWAPNSYHIACRTDWTNSVLVVSRDLAQRYNVPKSTAATSVAWSPDSWELAFSIYDGESSKIYVADRNAQLPHQIARLSKPVWLSNFSPNGRFLTANFTDGIRWETYVIDLDTSTTSLLNDDFGLTVDRVSQPTWSPDSSEIAFQTVTHLDMSYNYGPLYVANPYTRRSLRLSDNGSTPKWSADGRNILFESPELVTPPYPQLKIYTISADGTDLRWIADLGWNAVWMDNDQIAFAAYNGLYSTERTRGLQVHLLEYPSILETSISSFAFRH